MERQLEILLPTALAHGFDYRVPDGMTLGMGDIVTVPFGRGESLGVVWGVGKAALAAARMKSVAAHHAQFPPLSEAMRQFIDWAAWYNCAPKGAMLKMVLPVPEIGKSGRVSIESALIAENIRLSPLSGIQRDAASRIEARLGQGFSVSLLDGVTGSGKTEVYFDAMAKALAIIPPPIGGRLGGGRSCADEQDCSHPSPPPTGEGAYPQILVLLPEIALSVQWLARFEERFGFAPVVWHSEITPAKKRASWHAIAKGEARVVVGARSALFLPYRKLALIVVDEEHEASYKQEEGVIYHARDMAVARARFEQAPVVLVSATPSLESYCNAQAGKYQEISLPARHGDAAMPDIEMIDMRKTKLERGAFVSDTLRKALAVAVGNGHQAMLFLNRRGYAPLVLCRACGHRFQCPACTAWLVLHKGKPRLECHHCGYHIPVPSTCPSCQAEESLAACGPGVERLAEEVALFLPQARVAVMASDSAGGHRELTETLTAMSEKRIDLLIGTQMIAKGHHFGDLAVVGVVDADLGLAGGDLRAAERTYQLLHQLSGRAGREVVHGRVYLQSFLPEHPVMKTLLSGERNEFMNAEAQARRQAQMPPFSRLAAVIVESPHEAQAMAVAKQLAASAPPQPKLHILGPAPAPLYLLRGKYRYRLLARADRALNLPDYMRGWIDSVGAPSSVRVKIDIDPMSFF